MAAAEAPIPEGFWPKVRWTLTYTTSWMVPLVAIERFADGHYIAGWVLTVLFFLNLAIVSRWDQLATLLSERRDKLLTWALIAIGAAILTWGIVRLATEPRDYGSVDLHAIQSQLTAERTEKQNLQQTAIAIAQKAERDLATARKELQEAQAERDRLAAAAKQAPPPQSVIAAPAPEAVSGKMLLRKYTPEEAKLLLNAVSDLAEEARGIDGVLEPLEGLYVRDPYTRQRGPQIKLTPENLVETVKGLRQYKVKLLNVNFFGPVRKKYPDYVREINAILGEDARPLYELNQVVDRYVMALDRLTEIKEPIPLAAFWMAINPAQERFTADMRAIHQWKQNFLQKRAPEARAEISAFM